MRSRQCGASGERYHSLHLLGLHCECGAATLAIAYAKGRLVVLDFMELRHAPRFWRCLLEGWLLLVSGLIMAIYAGI